MLHLDTGNTGFMILCTSLVMLAAQSLRALLQPRWAALARGHMTYKYNCI